MHFNWLLIPTAIGALALAFVGRNISSRLGSPIAKFAAFTLAVVMALPALLFAVYYLHVLDDAVWFYTFRAMPYSELAASGIGLGLGLIGGWLKARVAEDGSPRWSRSTIPIALFFGLVVSIPYVKPLFAPLEVPLQTRWSEGVCLQSTPATCGPCSAATLLKQFNIDTTEAELARECFTYRGGTENWYVVRALERRGLRTRTFVSPPQPEIFPISSIAGVRLGNAGGGGHFITILGRNGDRYVVGDPLVGRLSLTAEELRARYYFTGFFLFVSRSG